MDVIKGVLAFMMDVIKGVLAFIGLLGATLLMILVIVGIPAAIMLGLVWLGIVFPRLGVVLLAFTGGSIALVIANIGRQGVHPKWDGGSYWNYWGPKPLNTLKSLMVFLAGAALLVWWLIG